MAKITLEGYKKFTEKRRVAIHESRITVGKGGRISINKVAYKKYFMKSKYVEFYYNSESKIIAIKILDEPTNYSYNVKSSKVSNVGFVNCSGFFNHNNIDVSVKRDTDIIDIDEDQGIILIKLKDI
jgi:hypothetical protein